ncbi:MAG: DNRLRE domain-containing protein [Phycisphaerales bacterium]|nr:MAG: DNRLRE domain-containing protein [Phycisphaerales bacterium]
MAGTVTVLPVGVGACCLDNGDCDLLTESQCLAQQGVFQGVGTSCSPNPCEAQPVMVAVVADKDNILYETVDGSISNALGRHLYTGNQNSGARRRAVVSFDLSAIPPGSTVLSAGVRLYCNQSSGMPINVMLHRLLADWGEGTSQATGNEGAGAAATTGDATWLHRFYPNVFWSASGGDYVSSSSAGVMVMASGTFYTWSTPALVADVQGWVNMPSMNFGWVFRGDENSSANGKRFDSRNSLTPANHPVLVVTYLPPGALGACCLADGSCVEATASECADMMGVHQGAGSECAMASCPIALEPFVDPLPLPAVAQPVTGTPGGAAHYVIPMTEQFQSLHRDLPPTRVWGYAGSYPGPTIEARRGEEVTVAWVNDLRVWETGELRTAHVLAVDTCLHGPNMTGEVPVTVVHLHGGHVGHESDGYPEYAFPPGDQSPVYVYPNNQPAATIWYHDHALGITRLNVMMGLAGFYILRDDEEDALNIPRGANEIPLAIQDRSFHPDGALKYHEEWHDHFFGDAILVNGKVWPYLDVNRGKYRFRALNGSNSRVYTLSLSDGAVFWQIGSDLGLLESPVPMTELTLTPGERADIVIDFASYAPGTEIILTNSAPAPYPGFAGVGVVPNVMKFIVGAAVGHTDPLPSSLAEVPRIPESEALLQRDFELRQIANTHCPDHHDGLWTINSLHWDDVTEYPVLNTTEIWAWVNRSGVSHPMHMHLVAFQVLDRQPFDPVTGQPTGPRVPPAANEMGWKDTVNAPPSEITRVIARFTGFTGLFPYHCHILEHEDHEMMRQFLVVAPAIPGDVNGDGVVDFDDLAIVLGEFGLTGPGLKGDLNGDGVVDFADLSIVLGAFGSGR